MVKSNRLYPMRSVARLIGNIDPRKVLAEAYRLKLNVMHTGQSDVVNERDKDRLLQHFAEKAVTVSN